MKKRYFFQNFFSKKNKGISSAAGKGRFRHFLIQGIALSSACFFSSLTLIIAPELPQNAASAIHRGIVSVQSLLKKPESSSSETVSQAASEEETDVPEVIAGAGAEQGADGIPDIVTEQSPAQNSIYDTVMSTALGAMTYYNQRDARWGSYLYGGSDPMCTHGCGPTVVAMLIHSFSPQRSNDEAITPVNMANWALEHGCYAPHEGSYRSLIPNSLSAFGLTVTSVHDRSPANASALLSSGHVLVALMGPGTLTQNGHFIIITNQLEDGTVSIADPNSLENSEKHWDLNLLLSELKNVSDSGAPLWAVSR